jgi:hypothetical protein
MGPIPPQSGKEEVMFTAWKQEKTTAALVDEAQGLADKLEAAKPHIVDSYSSAARFWAASYLAEGRDLFDLMDWKPAEVARFVASTQTKIAALRKKREYDSSDGLAIWLHTARAVAEPRIAPTVGMIWQHLLNAGPNADAMAEDLLIDAGLPNDQGRRSPKGFSAADFRQGSAGSD